VRYEDLDLAGLPALAARVFASLPAFAVAEIAPDPTDPTFVAVDERRREALLRAVGAEATTWSDRERAMAAAALDVVWHLVSYERLVRNWRFDAADADRTIGWLLSLVIAAIRDGEAPPAG
jgi:hypothetical protein